MGNPAFKAVQQIPLEDRASVFRGELPSLDVIADGIRDGRFRNITALVGAGMSVSAGIPDFRTPKSGIYDNLSKYNLPNPESVFTLDFFQKNPKPFCDLAKDMWPGKIEPTISHFFLKLLHDKGVLRRVYTQNIDGLELNSGIPPERIVHCHGNFGAAHCIECSAEKDIKVVEDLIKFGDLPTCDQCGGFVKPDITFFGEKLPQRFKDMKKEDFICSKEDVSLKTDLLLVVGTSLKVTPVSLLPDDVHWLCPRVLINREKVHKFGDPKPEWPPQQEGEDNGFRFDEDDNYRDLFVQGDCDEIFQLLAKKIGWADELHQMKNMGLNEHIYPREH